MRESTVLLVSHDASFVGWFDYEVGRMDALRLDAMDEVEMACARVMTEKIGMIVIHLSADIGSAEVARLLWVSSTLRRPVPVLAISERYQTDRALMLFQLGVTDYLSRLKGIAIETGVPVTFGMFSTRRAPDYWRQYFTLADETAAAGGRMFVQVHSRALNVLLSFETVMPFDRLPVWREFRKLPLAEQEAGLHDPEMRRKLVEAARERRQERPVGPEPRNANFKWLFPLDRPLPPYRSIAQIAEESNKDPVEVMIDMSLEKNLKMFFIQTLTNEDQGHVLEMMRHPRSVVTFSDSGAHVSQIMDSSLQSHFLSYWVREKEEFSLEQAMRMLTFVPASHWGLRGRGLLREGYAADVIVFDPARITPELPKLEYDLPAGARRLKQKASGLLATVVNGQVVLRNNEHTGALPGQLLRGPLADRN